MSYTDPVDVGTHDLKVTPLSSDSEHRAALRCMDAGRTVEERREFLAMLGLDRREL